MNEAKFVNHFRSTLVEKDNVSKVRTHLKNSSSGMDILWEENGVTVGLEAKLFNVYNTGDNRSQKILILLGNLMNGKNMINEDSFEVGYLFRMKDRQYILKSFSSKFAISDLEAFAEIVSLKRIYFYDEKTKLIELLSFPDFIVQLKKPPTK